MDGGRTRLFGALALAVLASAPAPQRPGEDDPRSSCEGVAVDNDQARAFRPSNVIRFTVRCDGVKYWFGEYPTYLSVSVSARPPATDGPGFIVNLVRGQGCSAGIRATRVVLDCLDTSEVLKRSGGLVFDVCFPPGASVWRDIDVTPRARPAASTDGEFRAYWLDRLKPVPVDAKPCPSSGAEVTSDGVVDLAPIDLPGPLPAFDPPPMTLGEP
jgi:hypothetical protein